MTKPVIAAKEPVKTELIAGETYHWCRCGRSKKQPFCDGSHKGTDLTPLAFTAGKSETAFLCQCKASANAPFCDGTHARLGDAGLGAEVPEISRDGAPAAEPTPEEPTVARIHALARDGLSKLGHHGELGAIDGVDVPIAGCGAGCLGPATRALEVRPAEGGDAGYGASGSFP